MSSSSNSLPDYSRWPAFWGRLVVAVSFVLIWFGGLVTTTDAGMAVPDWPNTYGYNMFAYPIYDWFFGPWDLFLEHGHRLLATAAGFFSIVLLVVTWKRDSRPVMRRFAWFLLALVVFQGVLGGVRVLFDDRALAKIHGCVGPIFFVASVAFCVLASRWFYREVRGRTSAIEATRYFSRGHAAGMLGVSYLQLVIGAFIRHVGAEASMKGFLHLVYMHVGLAVLIVLGTLPYWLKTRKAGAEYQKLKTPVNILALLVLVQFSLGLTTWVLKYGVPGWADRWEWTAQFVIREKSFYQTILVTAHMATGSLILAFWTVHVTRIWHFFDWSREARRDILARAKTAEIG
ncbi:MAG: COX15/CtaA family protein [Pirellulaceae bacterium]